MCRNPSAERAAIVPSAGSALGTRISGPQLSKIFVSCRSLAAADITEDSAMGKVLIVVGALATLAVGMLAADQATSQEYRRSYTNWWMVGRADDTTPCREAPTTGWSGASHDARIFPLAEACRQEWRRAHGTYIIPDSYRGPSKKPRGEGSWR